MNKITKKQFGIWS